LKEESLASGDWECQSIKPSEIGEKLWIPMLKSTYAIAKPGCAYYVFCASGGELLAPMLASLDVTGWNLRHCLVWVKNSMVFGRSDYHYRHEPCLYGWKPGAAHYFTESRSETSVMEFDKPLKNDLHPTMKPVKLIAYIIGNSSRHGELVFDAFLGSGTTLIAAEQSDRICYGCELSPNYCDVILTRWENLTGKTAVFESNIA
jgi:DNA modification methylase